MSPFHALYDIQQRQNPIQILEKKRCQEPLLTQREVFCRIRAWDER